MASYQSEVKIEVNSPSQVVKIDLPERNERMAVTETTELANIDVFGGMDKLFSLKVTVRQDEKIDKTLVSGKHEEKIDKTLASGKLEEKIDTNEIARCLECPVCLNVCKPPVQVNAYNLYLPSEMIIVTVLFP